MSERNPSSIQPAVLLLDELFSNLDTPLRQRLGDELKLLQRETGITMIYVTHHRIEALSLGDRLMVLSNGRLMTTGSPTELFETLQTSYVASCVHSN